MMNMSKMIVVAAVTASAMAASPSWADNIPTMANLVHRWSFNGSYDDTGSGTHQSVVVNGAVEFNSDNTAVFLKAEGNGNSSWKKGYLNLGSNLMPTNTVGVTLEIWAKPLVARTWSRVFCYGTGSSSFLDMCWTENADVNRDLIQFPNGYNIHNTMQPYTLNELHHISVVFEKDGNGGTWIRWTRRNTTTGEIESAYDSSTANNNSPSYNASKTDNNKGMRRVPNWTLASFQNPEFWLGGSFSRTDDAYAEYHEVRIWNIALTDGQLSASAKAGPDAFPDGNGQPDSWAEYISTEDGQGRYINTGVIGRSGTKVEAKFRQTSTSSTWPVFIGVDGVDANTRFHPVAFYYSTQLCFQYRSTANSLIYNPGAFGQDLVVISDYASDGTAYAVVTNVATGAQVASVSKTNMGEALDTGRPMYLLGCNGNTWLSDYFFGRCYYVKIWQTNAGGEYELVRSYVPCVKDGLAGLYDEVSHTIFYPVGLPFQYGLVGEAVTATWNGSNSNPSAPGNWLCYDNSSALIQNAVPAGGTAVTIDSAEPAPIASGSAVVAWNSTTLGSVAGAEGAFSVSNSATAQCYSLVAGNSGSGSVSIGDNASFTVTGTSYLGRYAGASGSFAAGGNATAQFNSLYIGNAGTCGMTIGDDAEVTVSGYSTIGEGAGSHGEVTQTGGTFTTGTHADGFNVGRNGTGTYNLSGGTLNVRQLLRVGWGGSTSGSVFNMSGGTLNLSAALSVGDWGKNMEFNMTGGTIHGHKVYVGGYSTNSGGSNGTGAFVQDSGDITLDDTIHLGSCKGTGSYTMNGGTLNEKWWIQLGHEGKGTFVQNGGSIVLAGGTSGGKPHSWLCLASKNTGDATFVMSNGTFSATAGIAFGEGSTGGTGRFEMYGGTMTVPTIKYVHGTATVALNGGTLQATGSNAVFLDGLGTVTVGSITVDTTENGYALGVAGTTIKVTPSDTPAITLAGAGSLDLSGMGVELAERPKRLFTVISAESENALVGMPTLAAGMSPVKISKSQDGRHLCISPLGLVIFVK